MNRTINLNALKYIRYKVEYTNCFPWGQSWSGSTTAGGVSLFTFCWSINYQLGTSIWYHSTFKPVSSWPRDLPILKFPLDILLHKLICFVGLFGWHNCFVCCWFWDQTELSGILMSWQLTVACATQQYQQHRFIFVVATSLPINLRGYYCANFYKRVDTHK